MANLKKENKQSSTPPNYVPHEAIETSENARKPQKPADNAKRHNDSESSKDPYNEDRVSVKVPANEDVNAVAPDDTVSPG